MDNLQSYLFGAEFIPHAVCLLWRPDLLFLHGGSDLMIAVAYFTIPAVILKAVRARPDLMNKQVAALFAAFILACGLSHVAGLVTLWLPLYGLQGLIKLTTALVSIYTAYMIVRLLPGFLSLPNKQELAQKEAALIVEAREREAMTEQNRRLEDFAYVAAHDLRTPLRGIDTISEMLREDLPSEVTEQPEIREQFDLLGQQSARMQRLVDDLLEYARAGAGVDVHEPVDLGATVHMVAEILQPPAGFEIVTEGELPVADLIRPNVELILRNLIGNAFKHHDRGEGRIVVRGLGWKDGRFCFEVEDDGPGIPDSAKARIFRAFERGSAGGHQVEGTGIGLAAVQRAVDAHGGEVGLRDAQPGRGAIFTVTLGQPWLDAKEAA